MKNSNLVLVSLFFYLFITINNAYAALVSAPVADGDRIQTSRISSDGKRVVYVVVGTEDDDDKQLLSAPIDGGNVVSLGVPGLRFTQSDFQLSFDITSDSKYVVFMQGQDLYTVPIAGGTPIKINEVPAASFRISPNGQSVAYLDVTNFIAETSGSNFHVVPILGGSVREINFPTNRSGARAGFFSFTPNSQRLVYIMGSELGQELASGSVAGGQSVIISPEITNNDGVSISTRGGLRITADGNRIVYLRTTGTSDNEVQELYSSSIAGGSSINLSAGSSLNLRIRDFQPPQISPDSQRVVFIADQNENSIFELYSVPIIGGRTVKLNGTLVEGGDVGSFKISGDSQYVVYEADQITNSADELFSTPISESRPIKLNESMGSLDLEQYEITPDSRYVLFTFPKSEMARKNILYRVPINGGRLTNLFEPEVDENRTREIRITDDGLLVVFIQTENDSRNGNLFAIPVDGGTAVKLNQESTNGTIDFFIGPESQNIVYFNERDNTSELFSASIENIVEELLLLRSLCFPIKTKNDRFAVVCL